ncbi:MAG: hypothetical protein KDA60_06985, partial [Planctomycetales bacterium]|nr:hypothetical protein [Planctomycetales bacterium]
VDNDQLQLFFTLPAQMQPGHYAVQLRGEQGNGLRAAKVTFHLTSPTGELPPQVKLLHENIDAILNATTPAERRLSAGTILSQLNAFRQLDIPTADVDKILIGLLRRGDAFSSADASSLRRLADAALIDARFTPPGPVPTPAGGQIELDLGNHVTLFLPDVKSAGETSLAIEPAPDSFAEAVRGALHVQYHLSSTADISFSQPPLVSIKYDPTQFASQTPLRLLQKIDGGWQDVTVDHDAGGATLYGQLRRLAELVIVQGLETPEQDWGDAPDSYLTSGAANGARHGASGLYFGSAIDFESDGQVSLRADGDDREDVDDEQGIGISGPLSPGRPALVTIEASAAGFVNAWIDFDLDGVWSEDEQILVAAPVQGGETTFEVDVPNDLFQSRVVSTTVARFRLSSQAQLGVTGYAPDGEVEDHQVTIASRFDYNADGALDCADLQQLAAALGQPVSGAWDLDGDHEVSSLDIRLWVSQVAQATPGDANLDGAVDATDLGIWQQHRFTSGVTWCHGDWNLDGLTDGADFNIWNREKFGGQWSVAAATHVIPRSPLPSPPVILVAVAPTPLTLGTTDVATGQFIRAEQRTDQVPVADKQTRSSANSKDSIFAKWESANTDSGKILRRRLYHAATQNRRAPEAELWAERIDAAWGAIDGLTT